MVLQELPEYVYKYISWEKDYHKRIILENKIFFSSVKNFNDPFDATIPLRYDQGTDDQIFNLYVQINQRNDPNLTYDEAKRLARNQLSNVDIRNSKTIQNYIDNQREIMATNYGIFSTSKKYDSVLMWSHYSNFHKGICIRFNSKKLRNYFENECPQDDLIIIWYKVEYSEGYPLYNPFELSDEDLVKKPLIIKSNIWEYEDEIRFILFTYPNKELTIPKGIIDQIILGCKICNNDREKIIEFSMNNNIELVQAFRKENEFGLGFAKVNV